jgi:hypothetical protein
VWESWVEVKIRVDGIRSVISLQIALVWDVLMNSWIADKTALLDAYHFKLSDLMPKLELKKLG